MKWFGCVALSVVLAVVQGCGSAPLRVAMYPYLPDAADDDFAAYKAGVEARFEAAYPDIDLEVDLLVVDDAWAVVQPGVEPYSFDQLVDVLHGDGRYDVVEIDSALLGELVETGLIAPWPNTADAREAEVEGVPGDAAASEPDWHPAAVAAATYDGDRYGYPHYLCSRFVFGHAPALDHAESFGDVAAAITRDGEAEPRVAMDLSGSWGTAATVLDLVFDQGDAAAGLQAFDSADLAPLRELLSWCPVDAEGRTRCLHDTEACDGMDDGDGVCGYDENSLVAEFVAGKLDAFVGYSERAHRVRRAAPDAPLHVSPLLLGPDPVPLVFVDVYVRRAGCEGACADAAFAFAKWMSTPEELEHLLMSRDADAAPPRYLLPANQAAYETSIGEDPLFVRFRDLTAAALPHPNAGLLAARQHIRTWVLEQLGRSESPAH